MKIKYNKVEQDCYLNYLVAKHILEIEEIDDIIEIKYNTTELIVNNQPIVMISK